jgi:hypothetical protein
LRAEKQRQYALRRRRNVEQGSWRPAATIFPGRGLLPLATPRIEGGERDFLSLSMSWGPYKMAGSSKWGRPSCAAWAKSQNRPCMRKVGNRRDGSLHTVCPSHGSKTPPYSERQTSEEGKRRIGAAATATWQRYRRDCRSLRSVVRSYRRPRHGQQRPSRGAS